MSRRIFQYSNFLKTIYRATPFHRRLMIEFITTDQILALSDIAFKILFRRIRISNSQKDRLIHTGTCGQDPIYYFIYEFLQNLIFLYFCISYIFRLKILDFLLFLTDFCLILNRLVILYIHFTKLFWLILTELLFHTCI